VEKRKSRPRRRIQSGWKITATDARSISEGAIVDHTATTDAELMAAFYAGDNAAFAELERRYGPRMRGYFRRTLRGRPGVEATAEELCQEVLIRIAQTRDRPAIRYDPSRGAVSTWIHSIAGNVLNSLLRKCHAPPASETDVSGAAQPEGGTLLDSFAGRETDPAKQVESKELVESILDSLPAEERQLLQLRVMEGLTLEQIARRTGTNIAAVRNQVMRILARLRRRYAELADSVPLESEEEHDHETR